MTRRHVTIAAIAAEAEWVAACRVRALLGVDLPSEDRDRIHEAMADVLDRLLPRVVETRDPPGDPISAAAQGALAAVVGTLRASGLVLVGEGPRILALGVERLIAGLGVEAAEPSP